jgi:hypothetical protein
MREEANTRSMNDAELRYMSPVACGVSACSPSAAARRLQPAACLPSDRKVSLLAADPGLSGSGSRTI